MRNYHIIHTQILLLYHKDQRLRPWRPLVALKIFFKKIIQYLSMLLSSLYNTFLCCVQVSIGIFFLFFFVISLGRVVVPSPKIAINLSGTYEKPPCKGESYWFSSQRDPLVQTYKHTDKQKDSNHVTLLYGFKFVILSTVLINVSFL